jgi:hypothetical protein
MKRNGLRAKSWEQRSCAEIEGEPVALQVDPDGRDNVGAPRLLVIYVYLIISLSEVKRIVMRIREQFQNGNAGHVGH